MGIRKAHIRKTKSGKVSMVKAISLKKQPKSGMPSGMMMPYGK